jgi:hypothetical protein
MKSINKILLILTLSLFLACSSDDAEVGSIKINFQNFVGDDNLQLNTQTYTKNGGETISIDQLRYIISNIVLIDTNGNEFVYPQEDSYFLINEEFVESKSITLQNVNANNYTNIRFGVGVDQSNYPLNGVDNFVPTAEDNQMMWSWSAGYIFMRIEGSYSSEQTDDGTYRYHIGSHGTNLDNYKEVNLSFTQPLAISETQTPEVNINFDVLKLFSGPHDMLLEDKDDIQIDPENAPKIAENYIKAFEIGMN